MKVNIESRPLTAFSHSSLTDIMMLLLIFFLLTSQFVVLTGVKVKLPGSKANDKGVSSQIVVTITNESKIYIDTKLVSINELKGDLVSLKNSNNDDNLIIRADKTVPIELVIKVIDEAKSADISKFTLQTEKE